MDKTTKAFVIGACVVVIGYGAMPLLNRGARLINAVREDRQIAEAIAEQARREDCDKNELP